METIPRKVVIIILYDSKFCASQLLHHPLHASCDRCVSSDILSFLTRGGQPIARIEELHYISTTHRFDTVVIMLEQLIPEQYMPLKSLWKMVYIADKASLPRRRR